MICAFYSRPELNSLIHWRILDLVYIKISYTYTILCYGAFNFQNSRALRIINSISNENWTLFILVVRCVIYCLSLFGDISHFSYVIVTYMYNLTSKVLYEAMVCTGSRWRACDYGIRRDMLATTTYWSASRAGRWRGGRRRASPVRRATATPTWRARTRASTATTTPSTLSLSLS